MQLREPEHYGYVTIFLQPADTPGERPTLGLWGRRRTVEMPYGTLQTALCRPSEIGIEGFDHLFTGAASVATWIHPQGDWVEW